MEEIPYRVGLQQRVLAEYRAPFFETLAACFPNGFSLFSGSARPEEVIQAPRKHPAFPTSAAGNKHILRGAAYLCYQSGWKNWLDQYQPDVLILEANPRYLSNYLMIRRMKRQNRRVIGWGLGAPARLGNMTSVHTFFRQKFLSLFDALLTYSARGSAEYIAAGIPSEKVFIAPNAALPRPTVAPEVKSPFYKKGRPIILFVGRLQKRKRIDLLLSACATLPKAVQPEVWIAGDGPERVKLEQIAAGVYPDAEFKGALYGEELATCFRQADLFVLPGSGGLAVQQAMNYALPVIVAESDGTQSNLVRPENGWCIPAGDLSALTQSLEEALSDPAMLRRKGLVSFKIVSDDVNTENMVSAFCAAIRYVMGGNPEK